MNSMLNRSSVAIGQQQRLGIRQRNKLSGRANSRSAQEQAELDPSKVTKTARSIASADRIAEVLRSKARCRKELARLHSIIAGLTSGEAAVT
ncbi:hypothetical protein NSE01_39930 [Novosphingobium sediminis]|uniref:Uncharacterized protein n=1 Tax=Novosphingobium sediminis TaxID=707214 RepID=A0A512AR11_9SPHN|nr:hypothetical protein NSE01_39930 [Novosphingobium sediminis]